MQIESAETDLGYFSRPREGTHPGVVLIPDVRGIYAHFLELAQRLTREGFAVLLVNVYRRIGTPEITDVESAMRWIRQLSDPVVLAEIQAARDYLATHDAVAGKPVGVMGFCMGGQYAILAACELLGFSACVPFYGMLRYADDLDPRKKPRSPLDAIGDLSCPLLGLYGEEDGLIPLADVREFEARLATSAQPGEIRLYADAGHAFLNDSRPETFRASAAADAWPRAVAFLHDQLDR